MRRTTIQEPSNLYKRVSTGIYELRNALENLSKPATAGQLAQIRNHRDALDDNHARVLASGEEIHSQDTIETRELVDRATRVLEEHEMKHDIIELSRQRTQAMEKLSTLPAVRPSAEAERAAKAYLRADTLYQAAAQSPVLLSAAAKNGVTYGHGLAPWLAERYTPDEAAAACSLARDIKEAEEASPMQTLQTQAHKALAEAKKKGIGVAELLGWLATNHPKVARIAMGIYLRQGGYDPKKGSKG